MKRSFLALAVTAGVIGLLRFVGCQASGVGDPCVPESEGADQTPNPNYFVEGEPSVESKSFQCETRLCLVNHFRGRVSCPFGQQDAGVAPVGASPECENLPPTDSRYCGPCVITGTNTPVPGPVPAQCTDRTADKAVYCSCRCANDEGKTNDGANYCTCPDGFMCAQNLINHEGNTDTGLSGGFCIKDNTAFVQGQSCVQGTCDPANPKPGCSQ